MTTMPAAKDVTTAAPTAEERMRLCFEQIIYCGVLYPDAFGREVFESIPEGAIDYIGGDLRTAWDYVFDDAKEHDWRVDKTRVIAAANGEGASLTGFFGELLDRDLEENPRTVIETMKAVVDESEVNEERAAIIKADQAEPPAEKISLAPTMAPDNTAKALAPPTTTAPLELEKESPAASSGPKPKSATKKKFSKIAKAAAPRSNPDEPEKVSSPVMEQAVANLISRAVMGEDVREELKLIPSEMYQGLSKNTKVVLGLTKKLYAEEGTGCIELDKFKSLAQEAGADITPFYGQTYEESAKNQLMAAITEHFKNKSSMPMPLAEEFLEAQGWLGKIRCYGGDFYVYRDGRYVRVDEMMVKSQLTRFLHSEKRVKTSRTITNDVVMNIQCLAYTEAPPSSDPGFIPLLNGVLDVDAFLDEREPVLLPHSPDRFITHLLPARFDPEADSVKARAVREKLLPNEKTLEVLQEFIGSCLVPGNEYKVMAIFYGETDTGKSVICAMMTGLLGEESTSCVSLSSMCSDRTFGLLPMVGKLVNITEETGITDKVAEDVIKKITSGSPVDVHRKYKEQLHWRPTTKLVFASNTLPRISDHSDASHNRILLFPFKVRILKSEQTIGMNDPAYWKDEADGILQWALMGLVKLRGRGRFQPTPEMVAELQEYQRTSQPIREWLKDTLVTDPNGSVCSTALYLKYHADWKESGRKPLGAELFATEVRRVLPGAIKEPNPTATYFGPTTGRKTRKWLGIRFKEDRE